MKKIEEERLLDGETLRQYVAENRSLAEKLTKRNEQYIFDLNKALTAANLSEEDIVVALHDILPALVEGQKTGQTARQQFGTVSEQVQAILSKPKEVKKNPAWMMWLDNTLLFFAMLAILTGGVSLFTKESSMASGILSLLATSATGGLIFYFLYQWIYQYERPGADQSKRPKMWKSMLILVGAMIVWILVYTGSMFLPAAINPVLNPAIVVAAGLVVLAFRFWFKKTFNIQGSFFTR